MKKVTDRTYTGLRVKHPRAVMIKATERGYEGYVFDEKDRKAGDNRYTQHTFMDKG